MASNTLEIKNRLRSIQSTKKITYAMKLVAISELQKLRSQFLKNREYDTALQEIVQKVIASQPGYEHPLFLVHEDSKPLIIVLSSDLGLAGAYVQNIYKLVEKHHQPENQYLWIGHKGYDHFKNRGYQIINDEVSSKALAYSDLEILLSNLISDYGAGLTTSLSLIYTEYVNAITFETKKVRLLPFAGDPLEPAKHQEIIFIPGLDEILVKLLPQFLNAMFYNRFLESKIAEFSSRRVAMENATDNAQELIEDLELEFNKNRQAAITSDLLQMIDYDLGEEVIEIKHSYEHGLDHLLNRKKVMVKTAYALTKDQEMALKEALEQRFSVSIILETQVDPSLIQGISLMVDGLALEGSMKQAFSELDQYLRDTRNK